MVSSISFKRTTFVVVFEGHRGVNKQNDLANMNKPKISFGAIKLNVKTPPAAEVKVDEPEVSGETTQTTKGLF